MSNVEFRLDRAGIGEILKSGAVAAAIAGLTAEAAGHARATTDLPVESRTYTTDRAAGSVVIADPAGLASQAKHGTLTRAAAATGLEVRPE